MPKATVVADAGTRKKILSNPETYSFLVNISGFNGTLTDEDFDEITGVTVKMSDEVRIKSGTISVYEIQFVGIESEIDYLELLILAIVNKNGKEEKRWRDKILLARKERNS